MAPEIRDQKSPEWEQPGPASVFLWEGPAPGAAAADDFRPWLDPYLLEGGPARGAVMVLPGGGYTCRVRHESACIARKFNELGFNAFVCHYRVLPHRYPAPLYDAARALRVIRCLAGQWNVKKDKLAVCGFSAGGHLAAMLGVHHGESNPGNDPALDRLPARPDALILCYAVLSARVMKPFLTAYAGPGGTVSLLNKMSAELHVNAYTPPAFLWQTADDPVVPVENCLLFAQALRAAAVPYEMHIFPHGPHGLGLAPDHSRVRIWIDLCAAWLKSMEWLK